MNRTTPHSISLSPRSALRQALSYGLVVLCFSLWGFANDVTNPMVKAFGRIYNLTNVESSLVQTAFYGGYFVMALPAALLNRHRGYRTGILVGLALFACGNFLFFPGVRLGSYGTFLIAYFIMTCGLSFLETSANPLVLSLGRPEKAALRLNFAQAFNPIGSLLGILVSIKAVQERLSPLSTKERLLLPEEEASRVLNNDLQVLAQPYVVLGAVLVIVFLVFFFVTREAGFPTPAVGQEVPSLRTSVTALMRDKGYRRGVVAQFFYVGAQIMCWTFVIRYGVRLFTEMGYSEAEGEIISQKWNLLAMVLFCLMRFVGTFLLRKVRPEHLLALLSSVAMALLSVTILSTSKWGLIALVLVSGCMSIMFPTIYALAMRRTKEHTPIGAAGLVMSILGGSLLPLLQAAIIDTPMTGMLPSVNVSFLLPLLSFVVILSYALSARKIYPHM